MNDNDPNEFFVQIGVIPNGLTHKIVDCAGCFRAESQKQVIELEFEWELRNAADASNTPLRKVNCLNFRFNKLYVPQNTAEWIDNVAGIKIARGDLVQHRRAQNKVLAA